MPDTVVPNRKVKFNWILAKPHRALGFKGYSVRMSARMKINTYDFSGTDRWDIRLYGKQQELIRKVSELSKPVVLVLENGKPVDLTYEAEHLDSILVAWSQ